MGTKKGMALIVVLFLVMLLAVIVAELSFTSKTQVHIVKNLFADIYFTGALQSAIELAKEVLKDDLENGKDKGKESVDSLAEYWSKKFRAPVKLNDNVSFEFFIEDEERKLNLNTLVGNDGKENISWKNSFKRLFNQLGYEGDKLVDNIIKYMQEPPPPAGSENGRDSKNPDDKSNKIKVRKIKMPEELIRIEGFSEEMLLGDIEHTKPALLNFITCYSSGKINVNTADETVLYSLSENITHDLARNIVDFRKETNTKEANEFKKLDDLLLVPGFSREILKEIENKVSINSTYFTIHITIYIKNITRHINVVLRRQATEKNKVSFTIIYLYEPHSLIPLPKEIFK